MQKTDDLDDETKFNPFDMWDGANFRLRVAMVDEYPNYDKSKFDAPSPIATEDDEIERLWRTSHELAFLTDKESFKSYEELQKRMNDVLGLRPSEGVSTPKSIVDDNEIPDFTKSTADLVRNPADDAEEEDLDKWLKELGNAD